MILFFTYLYGLTIRRNLGHSFQMGSALLPALALLFFYIGVMLRHTKKNRFVGIRTPRTLSSDSTWDKTHRLG
ncbi:MAG: SdpI family protein [bacterium]|nr:SdpI family protein [bacterium]